MLPNIGSWEMVVILLVFFLLFGSKRLPDVARGLGRGLREFKREMQGISEEITKEEPPAEKRAEPPKPQQAPPAEQASTPPEPSQKA